jgi:hypothetical protein
MTNYPLNATRKGGEWCAARYRAHVIRPIPEWHIIVGGRRRPVDAVPQSIHYGSSGTYLPVKEQEKHGVSNV